MKINNFEFKHLTVIILTSLIIITFGCEETEQENKTPTCTITSPNDSDVVEQGEIITISVDADDADGNITEVRFYIDGSGISSSSSFPYNYDWNTSGEEVGSHTIKATAKDNVGSSISDEITVSIIENINQVTDYDGNTYNTIKIGNQWWMAENLKTTHFADGTEITLVESNTTWGSLSNTYKAYCYYDNSSTNANTYGALYTWAAAMNSTESSNANPSGVQGVCPDGWHVPSDEEWTELIDYLGGTSVAGGKMKEIGTTHWNSPNTGATNESGFSAPPAGCRYYNGTFLFLCDSATFWSATENYSSYAWSRYLQYNSSTVTRSYDTKNTGFSVRCLRD